MAAGLQKKMLRAGNETGEYVLTLGREEHMVQCIQGHIIHIFIL